MEGQIELRGAFGLVCGSIWVDKPTCLNPSVAPLLSLKKVAYWGGFGWHLAVGSCFPGDLGFDLGLLMPFGLNFPRHSYKWLGS